MLDSLSKTLTPPFVFLTPTSGSLPTSPSSFYPVPSISLLFPTIFTPISFSRTLCLCVSLSVCVCPSLFHSGRVLVIRSKGAGVKKTFEGLWKEKIKSKKFRTHTYKLPYKIQSSHVCLVRCY